MRHLRVETGPVGGIGSRCDIRRNEEASKRGGAFTADEEIIDASPGYPRLVRDLQDDESPASRRALVRVTPIYPWANASSKAAAYSGVAGPLNPQ